MSEPTNIPTPAELAAWRALCEQATPEPWQYVMLADHDAQVTYACIRIGDEVQRIGLRKKDEEDARFIAAARTALPRLLDECERLRGLARELADQIQQVLPHYWSPTSEALLARPDVQALLEVES